MRPLNRRGTTLAELVVALALIGTLLLIVTHLLGAGARLVATSTAAVARNRDISTTMALLDRSIRGSSATDLVVHPSDTLGFDRRIAEAPVCRIGGAGLVVADSTISPLRTPVAGRDELLILTTIEPARWIRAQLTAVAPARCTPATPGLELGLSAPPAQAHWVRIVTPVRLRRYRSGGNYWLGLEDRIGPGSLQPFAGPIRGKIGFAAGSNSLVLQLGAPRTISLTVPLNAAGR